MFVQKHFLFLMLVISLDSPASTFESDIVAAAYERTKHSVTYDGRYLSIPYPGGDVPANIGVCTDVVVRSYRKIGTDLQKLVHEDMKNNFSSYPSKLIWGLSKPDRNIDHRRVPNLQSFLSRHGQILEISSKANEFKPGNLVTWMLPGNLPHIGIVTDTIDPETGNPMVVHNIGRGPLISPAHTQICVQRGGQLSDKRFVIYLQRARGFKITKQHALIDAAEQQQEE